MDNQTAQMAAQAVQIVDLTNKVEELTTKVDQLLALFNGARGAVTFVKWMGALASLAIAAYAALHYSSPK